MRYLLAVLLLLAIAPARLAHGAAQQTCATSGQQPEVITARAELQRFPGMLLKRLQLADLLLNASCLAEAIQVLEAGEAVDPGNRLLQYRLTRARNMVRAREYFEGIDKAEAAARLQRPASTDTARQFAASGSQAPQAAAHAAATVSARPAASDTTADKVAEPAPRRTLFSNVEPASRSN